MSDEPWEHLKAYGYAPGRYMGKCRVCHQMFDNLDKRAISCRACAEKRHAEVQTQVAMTDELPPLPIRSCIVTFMGDGRGLHYTLAVKAGVKLTEGPPGSMLDLFTADQMRAYGDARAVEALERAAALVESRAGPLRTGAYDALIAAAAAIRDF